MRQAAVVRVIKPRPAMSCSKNLNNAQFEMCSGFVTSNSRINCICMLRRNSRGLPR